ncbi:MAG: OB-fold nucleic acid binding domain-containing protein [Chthoniobacterales bacterium]|jgi:hypothetical protein
MSSNRFPALFVSAIFALSVARAEEPVPASTETTAADASTAIPAEDMSALEAKVGRDAVVEGFVKRVGKTADESITFLNFGDSKSGFVAVVFRSAVGAFPEGFNKYANQKVRVRGMLEKYKDRQIQIVIITPDQLEVVESAP